MTSPVLVAGGTGRLGRSVVARLIDAGQDVRVLARRQSDTQPQVTFFAGDPRQGDGIDPAVRGAGMIIHWATSAKGDTETTRNLVAAAAEAGSHDPDLDGGVARGQPGQEVDAALVQRRPLPDEAADRGVIGGRVRPRRGRHRGRPA